MGYKAGAVQDSSSQSQSVQDDSEVFYGAGGAAEANAQVVANMMGIQEATSLSSLPPGHLEVLLGSQVSAQAPGLELLGADSVTPGEYVSAAQQDNQSIPANVTAAANAGTQSFGATLIGAKPSSATSAAKASARATTTSASKASAESLLETLGAFSGSTSTSSSSSSNARYGLTTCPY